MTPEELRELKPGGRVWYRPAGIMAEIESTYPAGATVVWTSLQGVRMEAFAPPVLMDREAPAGGAEGGGAVCLICGGPISRGDEWTCCPEHERLLYEQFERASGKWPHIYCTVCGGRYYPDRPTDRLCWRHQHNAPYPLTCIQCGGIIPDGVTPFCSEDCAKSYKRRREYAWKAWRKRKRPSWMDMHS